MMAGDETSPLRPLRLRMATAARAVGKPQSVLEKDYALSYLLAGIAAVSALRESLVFKGGTSLRKVYFPGYRSSEGLTRRNGRRRAATHFRGGCVVIYEAFTTQPPYRRSR